MMRSWRCGRRKPGRVRDPRKVEDFFACMLVVRNLSEIGNAESPDSRRFQPDIVPDWRSWQARIATAPYGRASGQADASLGYEKCCVCRHRDAPFPRIASNA
jgi:hypothetical protein